MSELIERFKATDGRGRLRDAMLRQTIVQGDEGVADALRNVLRLQEFEAGDVLIRQDDGDDDIFFILSGEVEISVNGHHIRRRLPGEQVGEMAAIDAGARRSATVTATGPVVVGRVRQPEFVEKANRHPQLWRRIAQDLAKRLRERNDFVQQKNAVPVMFIGSSTERRATAEALRDRLRTVATVLLWTEDVFQPSFSTLEDLLKAANVSDFAVFVVSADDTTETRGSNERTPRDNVVFEIGLFMGRVGRGRTLMVNVDAEELHLPSDLRGLTDLRVTKDRSLDNIAGWIVEFVEDLGPY